MKDSIKLLRGLLDLQKKCRKDMMCYSCSELAKTKCKKFRSITKTAPHELDFETLSKTLKFIEGIFLEAE